MSVIIAGSPDVTANDIAVGRVGDAVGDLSDISVKDQIEKLQGGLEAIRRLLPCRFFNKKTNRYEIGFISQEVETVFPEAVFEHEDMLYLEYQRLTAPIVSALQQLDERLSELEKKIVK